MSNVLSRYDKYKQLINEKYYCISINPIDKLMMSTNQPFGSCMSLVREGEAYGGRNSVAMGIPSLFPNNSVTVGFATKGKHKNMYFSEDELRKDPDQRDKEQAYKFLKMTTRMIGYLGAPSKELIENTNHHCILDRPLDEAERLFFGRCYTKQDNENYFYRPAIELLLDFEGVKTGYSALEFVDANFHNIKPLPVEVEDPMAVPPPRFQERGITKATAYTLINQSIISNNKVAVIDRFGYHRQIYFDNLRPYASNFNMKQLTEKRHEVTRKTNPENWRVQISADPYSRGGCGRSTSDPPSKCDCSALKVINGEQNYSFVNSYVRACSICEEIGSDHAIRKTEDGDICEHCFEEKQYVQCDGCGQWYSELNKASVKVHKIKPLKEILPMLEGSKAGEKMYCTRQTVTGGVICVHCGKNHSLSYSNHTRMTAQLTNGSEVTLAYCNECLNNTVVCDKCKKLITIEGAETAMLLLPNKRTICFDCIDTLRLKKEKKAELKQLLDTIVEEDINDLDTFESTVETRMTEKYQHNNFSRHQSLQDKTQIRPTSILKDFRRQMKNMPAELGRVTQPRREKVPMIDKRFVDWFVAHGTPEQIDRVNAILTRINSYQGNGPFEAKMDDIEELSNVVKTITGDNFARYYSVIDQTSIARVSDLRDTEAELLQAAVQQEAVEPAPF